MASIIITRIEEVMIEISGNSPSPHQAPHSSNESAAVNKLNQLGHQFVRPRVCHQSTIPLTTADSYFSNLTGLDGAAAEDTSNSGSSGGFSSSPFQPPGSYHNHSMTTATPLQHQLPSPRPPVEAFYNGCTSYPSCNEGMAAEMSNTESIIYNTVGYSHPRQMPPILTAAEFETTAFNNAEDFVSVANSNGNGNCKSNYYYPSGSMAYSTADLKAPSFTSHYNSSSHHFSSYLQHHSSPTLAGVSDFGGTPSEIDQQQMSTAQFYSDLRRSCYDFSCHQQRAAESKYVPTAAGSTTVGFDYNSAAAVWTSAVRENSEFMGKWGVYPNIPFSGHPGNGSLFPSYYANGSSSPVEAQSGRYPFLSSEESVSGLPRSLTSSAGSGLSMAMDVNGQSCCLVCGDIAACQHYGVRSCEGCKGFFKRTTQKNTADSYVCLQNKNCLMDKHRRNRCQYCRYQKCLRVGMVKDIVRSESLKGKRGRLSSKAKVSSTESSSGSSVSMLSLLTKAHGATQPGNINSKSSQEMSQFNSNQRSVTSKTQVIAAIERSLMVIKSFADRIPGFKQLHKEDQRTLLKWNSLDLLALRVAFRLSTCLDKSAPPTSILLDDDTQVCCFTLASMGLSLWTEALVTMATRIHSSVREDRSTLAGLAAVTLLAIKTGRSVNSGFLHNPSTVYSLHHSFIEVLKSHCCTTILPQNAGSGATLSTPVTNLSNNSMVTTAAFLTGDHYGNCHRSASSTSGDSTLLSRILQERRTVQQMTTCYLIPALRSHSYATASTLPDYRICTKALGSPGPVSKVSDSNGTMALIDHGPFSNMPHVLRSILQIPEFDNIDFCSGGSGAAWDGVMLSEKATKSTMKQCASAIYAKHTSTYHGSILNSDHQPMWL